MFTITPTNFAGVTDTVLVNSQTTELLSFGSEREILLRFLAGENTGKLVAVGEKSLLAPPTQGVPEIPSGQLGPTISPENLRQLIEQLKNLTRDLEELERNMPQGGR